MYPCSTIANVCHAWIKLIEADNYDNVWFFVVLRYACCNSLPILLYEVGLVMDLPKTQILVLIRAMKSKIKNDWKMRLWKSFQNKENFSIYGSNYLWAILLWTRPTLNIPVSHFSAYFPQKFFSVLWRPHPLLNLLRSIVFPYFTWKKLDLLRLGISSIVKYNAQNNLR